VHAHLLSLRDDRYSLYLISIITYKVVVYRFAPAEKAGILPLFLFYP
jgi:hypothetical protein